MATHNPHKLPNGMNEHSSTYSAFLNASIAVSLISAFVLVALVAFRFMDSSNVFTGFAGIIVGVISTLIGWRAGANWMVPGILLVLFGVGVAINL